MTPDTYPLALPAPSIGPLPTLEIGAQVGPYRIIGELGGGGMGMVYRAVHSILQRPAAIKVLRPELGNYSIAIDRFLTEARATTAVRHPGIVEVYDYGYTPAGHAFIAMELLEGRTLGARLDRGPLSVIEAMTITRRIAAPLAVAHERGVVHRDLKPDNIFLVPDHEGGQIPQVKILDFGIAKLESTVPSNRTTMGVLLGTPAYMSPEQCRGITDCDHRTDLYALGCILFEMLAGLQPYSDNLSSGELLAAHLHSPIPDLSRFATVPTEVARLTSRLLSKSPEDRPQRASELVAEIDCWLAASGNSRGAVHNIASISRRRAPLRFALLLASALALSLAGLGLWYGNWSRSPSAGSDDLRPLAPAGTKTAEPTGPSRDQSLTTPPERLTTPLVAPSAPSNKTVPPPPTSPVLPSTAKQRRRSVPVQREVTTDLGDGGAGDVNTTVVDVDH